MSEEKQILENSTPIADMGATNDKKEKFAALYRVLAVLFFALAAGGLFLGLIGSKISALAHILEPAENAPLKGSLFALVFSAFSGIFSGGISFAGGVRLGILEVANYACLIFLALAVVASLVLAVLSFIPKLQARKCAVAGGTLVALAYGWALVHSYYTALFAGLWGFNGLVDLPLLIIAGIAAAVLAVVGMANAKGSGFFRALMLIMTCAAIVGMLYPGSLFGDWSIRAVAEHNSFSVIAAQILLVMLFVNFVFSAVRLTAKRGAAFDLLRSIAQLIFVLLLIVAFIVTNARGEGRFAVFTSYPIAVALVLGATLINFLLGIVLVILAVNKAAREEAEEEADGYTFGQPAPAPAPVAPAPIIIQTAPAPAPQPQPAQAEHQPVQQPAAAPVVFYPMPMYQQPAPAPQPQPQPQPQPAPQPAPQPQPQPAPKAEPTDFERKMAAIARGEAEQPAAPIPSAPVKAAKPQPIQQTFYDGQYTYDPFLNSLTPQEKNEFGDLFIGKKHGSFGLPTYVIGGDNSEFFRKVFIYLGRFRSHISENLLGKIYAYVNET